MGTSVLSPHFVPSVISEGKKNLIPWSITKGCKDSFERFIHIEQQMTFLQYFFVKQTICALNLVYVY